MLAALLLVACTDPSVIYSDPPIEWPDPVDLPPRTGARLYVTNNGDDTITVLDAASFEVIDRAPVGLVPVEREGPTHIGVTPDGAWAFIGLSNYAPGSGSGPHGAHGTGRADGYVLKMSLADDRVVDSVRVEPNPHGLKLMPDGITVLQSHFDLLRIQEAAEAGEDLYDATSDLVVIDGASMQILRRIATCPAPHSIGVAPDGSAAYAGCFGSDEIAIVDMTGDDYPVTRLAVGDDPQVGTTAYAPYAVTVAPDGSAWLSCWMSDARPDSFGEVRRFDPERGEMDLGTILREPGNPMFGAFSADGSRFYVPYQLSDVLAVFDPATGEVLHQAALADTGACLSVYEAVLSPDESSLYVICNGDRVTPGTLLEMDPATLEMRRFSEVGVFPVHMAVVPP